MNNHKNDFFSKIAESAPEFTPSENTIAEYLMQNYPTCMLKNASELAAEIHVNVSTVTRFFKKIGYQSIRNAQADFKNEIDLQSHTALMTLERQERADVKESLKGAYIINDIRNIESTINEMSTEKLDILIGILSNRKNQITISGSSHAYAIAYYLYMQLKRIRPNITLLDANRLAIAEKLATTQANDALIIFNFRKYSKFDTQIARIFQQHGRRIITFTDSPMSPVGKIADLAFVIKTTSQTFSDSYVAAMTLINLITDTLAENWEDYIMKNDKLIEKIHNDLKIFP